MTPSEWTRKHPNGFSVFDADKALEDWKNECRDVLNSRLERICSDIEYIKGILIELRYCKTDSESTRYEGLLWDELDALLKAKTCIEKHAVFVAPRPK